MANAAVFNNFSKTAIAQANATSGSTPGVMLAAGIKPVSDLDGLVGLLRRASRDLGIGLDQRPLLTLLLRDAHGPLEGEFRARDNTSIPSERASGRGSSVGFRTRPSRSENGAPAPS